VTSARPIPMTDDHGDQFPGAVPASAVDTASRPDGADERLVRMSAAYTEKINAAVQADREGLAYELAEQTFPEELAGSETEGAHLVPERHTAGRRTPTPRPGSRPPATLGRMGRLTRRSLDRLDRYTVDAFNPRPPHALYAARPDESA
jgi:hypothetical protein